jgi:hypothetical protein
MNFLFDEVNNFSAQHVYSSCWTPAPTNINLVYIAPILIIMLEIFHPLYNFLIFLMSK